MMIQSIYHEINQELTARAKAIHFDVQGPADTEYGYGWAQTTSFWSGDRRLHLYYDITGKREVIEVADKNSEVLIGTYETVDQVWEVMDCFLHQGCNFEELPDCSWEESQLGHDKFIPHPPAASNPANIATLLEGSQWTVWNPPQERVSLLKKLRKALSRRFRD